MAVVSGMVAEGVVVGDGMKVICKQTSDLLPAVFPQIETVREDVLGAGRKLANLLIQRIAGHPAEELKSLEKPIPSWRGSA